MEERTLRRSMSTVRSTFFRSAALALILLLVSATSGCGSTRREIRDEPYLQNLRDEASARYVTETRKYRAALMERVKGEYDDFLAGRRPKPPTIDYLILTGGGDNGAFG